MNYPQAEPSTTSLPDDFAQQVLQLYMQMEFQESSSLQVVQQLNQLYRKAVQFYINKQDYRKIQHFQRKLQQLFTNPRTLQGIQNKQEKVKCQNMRVGKDYSTSLKKQMNKFNEQSQGIVKSMLVGSEIKFQRTCRLVNQNIENQEQKLRKRLESRSKSRHISNIIIIIIKNSLKSQFWSSLSGCQLQFILFLLILSYFVLFCWLFPSHFSPQLRLILGKLNIFSNPANNSLPVIFVLVLFQVIHQVFFFPKQLSMCDVVNCLSHFLQCL